MKPFDILVYAIVAVVLLFVLYSIISVYFQPATLNSVIKGDITKARSDAFAGKLVPIEYNLIPGDTTIIASSFKDTKLLVSVECVDPKICCNRGEICGKEVEWDYGQARVKQEIKAVLFTRCVNEQGIDTCKIYIGEKPAQAKIYQTAMLKQEGQITYIKVTAGNSGEQNLALGSHTLALYKKANQDWIDTGEEFEPKTADLLAPQQTQTVVWELQALPLGDYKATVKFEAPNAGYDQNNITFTVSQGNTCIISGQQTQTIADVSSGKYEEIHYCTGCLYGYECAAAWNENQPGKSFIAVDKDSAYCIKDTYEGAC